MAFNIPLKQMKRCLDMSNLENELALIANGSSWRKAPGTESADNIPDSSGISILVWRPKFKLNGENHSAEFRFVLKADACVNELSHKESFEQGIVDCQEMEELGLMETENGSQMFDLIKEQLEFWYVQIANVSSELIVQFQERIAEIFCPPLNQLQLPTIKASLDMSNIGPAF